MLQRLILAVCLTAGLVGAPAAQAGEVEDRIHALTGQFDPSGAALGGGAVKLRATTFLPRFYALRGYRPAWFGTGAAEPLFAALQAGLDQGFRPADFHLPLLFELQDAARAGGADEIAAFDLVATEAALRLIHYTIYGKVDPEALDPDWNFTRPVIDSDPAQVVNDYLDGEGFAALMARIGVHDTQYAALVTALARYRAIADDGGWQSVPEGATLRPGMTDARIWALRQWLAAEAALTGGLPAQPLPIPPETRSGEDGGTGIAAADPAYFYDPILVEDVKRFQARHGLEADGLIGPRTFQALNRTAAERVDQLRLSLERARWLMYDLEDEFVLVNIAGARTYLVRGGRTVWSTRSITGSQYRKTPVFRDKIRYMEFNPTWTVPRSIFLQDKLARIRKDPGYLARNNYVVRASDGRMIPPASVNWWADRPAVTLVQKPGPDNALGRVKFMFPNSHSVYLHDTNDHGLFDRNARNLSSGCVRLEHPYEFANLLMEGDPDWSTARMQAILDSGKTTRVNLPRPVTVLLTYWTAWVEDGAAQFREDIYERDAAVLKALDG